MKKFWEKRLLILLVLLISCTPVPQSLDVPVIKEKSPELATFPENLPTHSTLASNPSAHLREKGVVTRVADGDTFNVQLDDGSTVTVRLLGIDFPDLDSQRIQYWTNRGFTETRVRYCYAEGNKAVKERMMGAKVLLWSDDAEDNKDKYGRVLRYVQIEGIEETVNENLVFYGLAVMRDWGTKLCLMCVNLQNIEKESQRAGRGCLWQTGEGTPVPAPAGYVDEWCVALKCPAGTNFVGSSKSTVYHACDCRYASQISKSNLVCFRSKEEAENMGYRPAERC